MLRIVCWKWKKNNFFKGTADYGVEHVHKLQHMIDRNITIPYEFVCITDDPTGLDGSIRVVPLWDDLFEYGYCFVRLKAFSEEMADLIGPRFVSIDLDCLIVSDITPLLDNNNDFMMWESGNAPAPYCGSMWMMNAGARKYVWEWFDPKDLIEVEHKTHGKRLTNKLAYDAGYTCGSDQAWISYLLYPNEKTWTHRDGIWNFRKHFYGKFRSIERRLKKSRIIFFTGKFDPSYEEYYDKYPWIKKYWK